MYLLEEYFRVKKASKESKPTWQTMEQAVWKESLIVKLKKMKVKGVHALKGTRKLTWWSPEPSTLKNWKIKREQVQKSSWRDEEWIDALRCSSGARVTQNSRHNAKGRGGDGKGVDIFHTCFLHMCPDFQLYLSKLKSIKYEKRFV